MKHIAYLLLMAIVACKNNTSTPVQQPVPKDTTTTTNSASTSTETPVEEEKEEPRPDHSKYHIKQDSIVVYQDSDRTITYYKEEINEIIDYFPALYNMPTYGPDEAFGSKSFCPVRSFNYEQGQDQYYILYAYFLKSKLGIEQHAERRQKLISIYGAINEIHGQINQWGTHFGHQYSRIHGYAEFSIYWYTLYAKFFDRPYDITKQKEHYIAELKQIILDEDTHYQSTSGPDEYNARRIRESYQAADLLDSLITDNFYLRMAKSFEYDHYAY